MKLRKGFTLVEMLVVLGIIAVLIGAGMGTFSSATKKAQKAKGQELVDNVATALTLIYQEEGNWPRRILAKGAKDGELTADVAYDIASRKKMSLTTESGKIETTGNDRMGILTPWGADVVKRAGKSAVGESTRVPSGGTIKTHRLHFAVDTTGEGYVNASVGGETLKIRASAVVWCYGLEGKERRYSEGLKYDHIYSWSKGQIKK